MGNAFNADRGVRGVPRSRHAPDFTGAGFVQVGPGMALLGADIAIGGHPGLELPGIAARDIGRDLELDAIGQRVPLVGGFNELGRNRASLATKLTRAGSAVAKPCGTIRASSPKRMREAAAAGRKIVSVTSSGLTTETSRPPGAIIVPGSTIRYSTRPGPGARMRKSLSTLETCRIWASAWQWRRAPRPRRRLPRSRFRSPRESQTALAQLDIGNQRAIMKPGGLRPVEPGEIGLAAVRRLFALRPFEPALRPSRAARAPSSWASASASSCWAMTCPACTTSPSWTRSETSLPGYLTAMSVRVISIRPLLRTTQSGNLSAWT
jgi:hypothetical protein